VDVREIVVGERKNVCDLMALPYGRLGELGKENLQEQKMLRNKPEFCNFLGVGLHRLVVP
jgi:hypothetical protein